jgi:MFS family permease
LVNWRLPYLTHKISDLSLRFETGIFIQTALVCYSASMVTFSRVNNIMELYAGQIVSGLGSAMMFISAYTMATDFADSNERGKSVGPLAGGGYDSVGLDNAMIELESSRLLHSEKA